MLTLYVDSRHLSPWAMTVYVSLQEKALDFDVVGVDIDAGERAFARLAEGGKIDMPIAETFWAKRFGMVTDRFGIPWMVNVEITG